MSESYPAPPSPVYPTNLPVGKPSNYLVLAILSMIIGFLPLGVVATVYAARVDGLWFEGRHEEAVSSAQQARTWAIASFVVTAIFAVLGLVFFLVVLGAMLNWA